MSCAIKTKTMAAQSGNNAPMDVYINDAGKRNLSFLESCAKVKNSKSDLEGLLAREKAEKRRYQERIKKLKVV